MKRAILWTLWICIAVVGGIGIVERLISGHDLAGYTSYVPWGLWVATYIYFIGLSAGAFLLSSMVYVFKVRRLERIAKLSLFVAVITLVMALLTILFDIGHMERFFFVYIHPQFHSMMAWMVWLYTAYFLLLLGEMYFALRRDVVAAATDGGSGHRVVSFLARGRTKPLSTAEVERDDRALRVLGTIGVPLAIAFHGGVGALFGTVAARVVWHSPIYPILFLTGALVSGGALMTFVVAFLWPRRDRDWRELIVYLGRIVLGLVLLDVLLEWAEYSIPLWYGVGPEVEQLKNMLFGSYWYVFWIFHVAMGVIIPVYLLVRYRGPRVIGVASALVAASYLAVRLNLVIPGLVTPELKGLETAYLSDRLSYTYLPTLFEWQVVIGVAALGTALFYLGYRHLPLVRESGTGIGGIAS